MINLVKKDGCSRADLVHFCSARLVAALMATIFCNNKRLSYGQEQYHSRQSLLKLLRIKYLGHTKISGSFKVQCLAVQKLSTGGARE